jgi:cytochrome-b5 reductase
MRPRNSSQAGKARTVAPLRYPTNFLQGVRRYATPAGEEKKSSSGLLYAVLAAGAGAGAYYAYTVGAAPKPLPPAVPALTGDGQWVDLKLTESVDISPNTKRLRFELPSEDHVSGLKVASCLLTKYKGPDDKKPTIRPYTPTTDEDERGYMDLIVKKYEGGPMSTHIHDLKVDQTLAFKGPLMKYEWTPNKHEHIALIAGGTGITPMYQLLRAIFKNPEDKTKVTLVFGNMTEKDVLLKKELDELENTYPQRFKAYYVLDNAPKDAAWATQGRVTKELLKTVLPEPASGNNKIFVCGPPGMYKAISGTKVHKAPVMLPKGIRVTDKYNRSLRLTRARLRVP